MGDISVSFRLKVRKETDRKSLDARLQNSIRSWNKLDSALYDHFIKLLDQKIEKFGKERMQTEIAVLKGNIIFNCMTTRFLIAMI